MPLITASRVAAIQPFYVMEILARARELEARGRSVIHMEIGEPDFVTPQPIIDAGKRAMDRGDTHYTPASGLSALREAIADFYDGRYGVRPAPERIIITPGRQVPAARHGPAGQPPQPRADDGSRVSM